MHLFTFIRKCLDAKKTSDFNFLTTTNENQQLLFDENINDIISIYNFKKYNKTIQNNESDSRIKGYMGSNFPFTAKELFTCIYRFASYNITSFTSRIKCSEIICNYDTCVKVLQDQLTLNIVEVMQKNIPWNLWINHFIWFCDDDLSETNNNKLLTQKKLLYELLTKNTIARGVYAYRTCQMLCGNMPKILGGAGQTYDVSNKTIHTNLRKCSLDSYFHQNPHMIDYLIPMLQLYKMNGFLTIDNCAIAVRLVRGNENLTGDLADFFATLQGRDYTRYRQWGEQNIRGRHVAGGQNMNMFTGKQSVHALDGNRSKFMTWLVENTNDFINPLENINNIREDDIKTKNMNARNIINAISAKSRYTLPLSQAMERYTTDNTRLTSGNTSFDMNLLDIFHRICYIIGNHEHVKILTERLIEEMTESAGTCYSGHLNRLFNVFSGFEENLLSIDVSAEIAKTIKVRLQDVINEREDYSELILDYMTGDPWDNNVKEFVTNSCIKLREQMRKENETVMSSADFIKLFNDETNKYFGIKII